MSTAAIAAIVYKPAHAHSHIAAVAHMFAAVVNHFVFRPIFIIAHAHKNPTHETTCAAILPGSLTFESYISGRIIEMIIKSADHSAISMCVLIPAG
jgi:hypothetical protein